MNQFIDRTDQNLTDEELRSSLKDFNIICGPLNSQTRFLYQKKLNKLLKERNKAEKEKQDLVYYKNEYFKVKQQFDTYCESKDAEINDIIKQNQNLNAEVKNLLEENNQVGLLIVENNELRNQVNILIENDHRSAIKILVQQKLMACQEINGLKKKLNNGYMSSILNIFIYIIILCLIYFFAEKWFN